VNTSSHQKRITALSFTQKILLNVVYVWVSIHSHS